MGDRWPLTGRVEELRFIGDVFTDGAHRGVVIAGQPGVGKTRLAGDAAAAFAARGWSVNHLAGTATGNAVMLGAFAQWADDPDAGPLRAVRQITTALTDTAGGAPLLLVVDDAHLLDDLSALVLHHLVAQGVAAVIATIRSGEPAPDAVTALWKDGRLERLELQALSRLESRRLLQAALGAPISADCAERTWKLTRGNVLFLRHLVEHERASGRLVREDDEWHWRGTPSVSPSLIELVELQIGAVPDDVRDVVDLVALAQPVARSCLTSLVDPRAIEAAEARGLVGSSPNADVVSMSHPLYGEVRMKQCGALRLRRLRGELATAMAQASGRAAVDPLRLGVLWLESDLAPDPQILARAANVARSRLDLDLAERLARAAVEASGDPMTKLLLAYVLFLLEKGTEAADVLDAVGTAELPAPTFVNPEILRAANELWVLRSPERSQRVIDDALQRRHGGPDADLRTFRATQLVLAARPAEAIEAMAAVVEDDLDPFGHLLGCCAEIIALGDLGRPGRAAERAAAGSALVSESPDNSFQGTGVAEFHAYALLSAGFVDRAVTVAEQQHRLCASLPGMARSMATAVLGMTALAGGDLPAAIGHLHAAGIDIGSYGDVSGIFYRFRILYAEALARSGDLDAAVAALEAATRSRHPAYVYVESAYLLARAWVAAAGGHVDEARKIAAKAAEFARTHGQLAREVVCLQAAAQFGDHTVADRLGELAVAVEGPRAAVALRYARALADGDPAGLDAASRDFEAMGDVLASADAAAQAAAVYRAAGRRGSALTAGARAQQLALRCGGAVSPALAAARFTFPFTEREREVAVLVSRGLSNREIAEAMSLSVRTVEGHVYRANAKAGVANRAELSSLMRQLGRSGAG